MTQAFKLDIRLLSRFQRLFLGYSGGLDSTVLLYLLAHAQLKTKIQVVHVHHGLSHNAESWLQHCQFQCQKLALPLQTFRVNIASSNIEQNAREARQQIFASLLTPDDAVLLAHHADDQAETLLLNILRGSGIQGAAAMLPQMPFAQGVMLRPLLPFSRQMLYDYALQEGYQWIEDESNQDSRFSRNFLRQEVMPILKKRWPSCVDRMRQFSQHCQNTLINMTQVVNNELDLSLKKLSLSSIDIKNKSLVSNILYFWLKQHQIKLRSMSLINQIIDHVILTRPDAMPHVNLGKSLLRRYKKTLYLTPVDPLSGFRFVGVEALIKSDPRLSVQFRQGGEAMRYHGQTQSLKKLFQRWEVPPWERAHIPLIYCDNKIIAVAKYAISDECPDFLKKDDLQRILC